ncbi:MAG: DUF4147 domain-containing protein [Lachnospiraceae bacterium]|nr:DUF4147 domain-containing protein [Lachnospiraceae bacterium]
MKEDAIKIVEESIKAVLPDRAVEKAVNSKEFGDFIDGCGRLILISVGKAGWKMADVAARTLGERISEGLVVTKYHHVMGEIPGVQCIEAGHPTPDENSVKGARKALEMVENLSEEDRVLLLISGGGSALFEVPAITLEELQNITGQLLSCGADIGEINTIRKHLSLVKGGRFAEKCAPAKVFACILSDVLGDAVDTIASGPTVPDTSTSEAALKIVQKYNIVLSDEALEALKKETPKALDNSYVTISGSVRELCKAASEAAERLGYETILLTDGMNGEAREIGAFMGNIAETHQKDTRSVAYIAGGESIVHIKGTGKGGRNQELALAATEALASCSDTCLISVGSDGTDGPTDAAGGYVDMNTLGMFKEKNMRVSDYLENNDAHNALKASDGLIFTGPPGTNVNDVTILLIKR